jgi:hypothetical protein
VTGQRLGINPFDQPNVQSAKDATARILASGETEAGETPSLADLTATLKSGDYVAVLAYLPRDVPTMRDLQAFRLDFRDQYGVATTLGFGPRYLHSTGQLHKGGANNGVFVLLTKDAAQDIEVPGKPYSFDKLCRSQALGDLRSLQAMGRRVTHIHLQGNTETAIQAFREGRR